MEADVARLGGEADHGGWRDPLGSATQWCLFH